jgi:hypothetical protein
MGTSAHEATSLEIGFDGIYRGESVRPQQAGGGRGTGFEPSPRRPARQKVAQRTMPETEAARLSPDRTIVALAWFPRSWALGRIAAYPGL